MARADGLHRHRVRLFDRDQFEIGAPSDYRAALFISGQTTQVGLRRRADFHAPRRRDPARTILFCIARACQSSCGFRGWIDGICRCCLGRMGCGLHLNFLLPGRRRAGFVEIGDLARGIGAFVYSGMRRVCAEQTEQKKSGSEKAPADRLRIGQTDVGHDRTSPCVSRSQYSDQRGPMRADRCELQPRRCASKNVSVRSRASFALA